MAYGISRVFFCQALITTDENSYIFQANNFLDGIITRSYPTVYAKVINQKHIIFDEQIGCVSRYAPGHVLWLVPGILLGDPFLMSAFGAAIALWIIAKCGSLLDISRKVMIVLLLCSPCFIFTFGTLLSHTSGFVASSLMLLAYILWRRTGAVKFAVLAGLALGWLFHNRTLTAVCIAVPFGLDSLIRLSISRKKQDLLGTLAFALTATGCVVLLLIYNYKVVGHPFVMTHIFYDTSEAIGFGDRHTGGIVIHHNLANGLKYLVYNVKLLDRWLFGFPGSLVLMTVLAVIGWNAGWTPLLICSTILVWLGYIFFWYPGPDETGPGYYFETLPFVYMAGGLGLSRLWSYFKQYPRQRLVVSISAACVLAVLAGSFMFTAGRQLHSEFYERGRVLEFCRTAPTNSLIFVPFFNELSDYIVSNPRGQESDPLMVHSIDGANKAVIKHFPGRKPFMLKKHEQNFQFIPIDSSNIIYSVRFACDKMGHRTGTNIFYNGMNLRVAQSGKHERGWLAFGQKVHVFPGCFTVQYDLEVSGCPSNKSAAAVDVAIHGGRKILTGGVITGQIPPGGVVLEFTADDFCVVEPRVFYNGNSDIFLRAIHIREASK